MTATRLHRVLLVTALGALPAGAATIAGFEFGDETNGATLSPTTTAAGVTVSAVAISPGLIDGSSFTEAQSTGGNPDGRLTVLDAGFGNMTDAIANDEYVQVTINPNGNEMTLDGISLDARGGGSTGTRIFGVFVSTDGFASDPAPGDALYTSSDLGTSYTNTGTIAPGITDTTDTVTLRLYFHTGSNSRDIRIDNIVITGSVVPEPSSLGFGLLGCAALLRRRRS
jgi:uncharacterized protein (TIGR03382 family)